MITDNQVYTHVANFIRANFGENVNITSKRLYVAAEFPTVSIVCIDDTPVSETIDLTESNRRSTFEVNVYTNTTMQDARDIANNVKRAFKECGYRCRVFTPLDNANDLTINRYVGSYTRVIGEGDNLHNE